MSPVDPNENARHYAEIALPRGFPVAIFQRKGPNLSKQTHRMFQQEAPAPIEPGLLITKTIKGRLARGDASKALPNPFVKLTLSSRVPGDG